MAKPIINRVQEISVSPSPKELAQCFWDLYAEDQVEFFNELMEISRDRLIFQLAAVRECSGIPDNALEAMRIIGEYGCED